MVAVEMTFQVETAAGLVVQLRPSTSAGVIVSERMLVSLDGMAIAPPIDIPGEIGGSLQRVDCSPGLLLFSYDVTLSVPEKSVAPAADFDGGQLERLIFMRPSRYCPSDHIAGFALSEFGQLTTAAQRVEAVVTYIFERIAYVSGSSGVHDWAEDTLLTGVGVCRDFAHLGVTLCRALDVPARFVAVYAPGLDPMDFHAVFEAWHDGGWWAYDATRKVPRQTLVRIATGRDAADTPFATVVAGTATLIDLRVTATSEGVLPYDDHVSPVALA